MGIYGTGTTQNNFHLVVAKGVGEPPFKQVVKSEVDFNVRVCAEITKLFLSDFSFKCGSKLENLHAVAVILDAVLSAKVVI